MQEMYNGSVTAANKIISYDDLYDIFLAMNDEITKWQKVSKNEEMTNQRLEYKYQKWTFKDSASSYKISLNFYDDTEIKFDNFNNFSAIFNNRLEEVKSISVHYYLSYSEKKQDERIEYHTNSITMWIYEDKMEVNVSLDSNDGKTNHIYEIIKDKLNNAPEKYDSVIRNKSSIMFKVGMALAFIPAIVVCILLLFVPTLRMLFASGIVLFPIVCCMIAFVLNGTMSAWKLEDLYKNIVPSKKYISYEKGYKDDIDRYTNTSEILIGKKTHNMENRKQIMEIYDKYKKYIPYEIGVIAILSLIVIFLK